MNELPEYNSEVLQILREEYPGLSWILVFKENGGKSAIREIKDLENNELMKNGISSEGMELMGLVGGILDSCY